MIDNNLAYVSCFSYYHQYFVSFDFCIIQVTKSRSILLNAKSIYVYGSKNRKNATTTEIPHFHRLTVLCLKHEMDFNSTTRSNEYSIQIKKQSPLKPWAFVVKVQFLTQFVPLKKELQSFFVRIMIYFIFKHRLSVKYKTPKWIS